MENKIQPIIIDERLAQLFNDKLCEKKISFSRKKLISEPIYFYYFGSDTDLEIAIECKMSIHEYKL